MDLGHAVRGKRVLITGASSGIGAHLAMLFARAGCHLALSARRLDKLEAVARACSAAGAASVTSIALDVTDLASVEAGVETAARLMAGLDIVIDNAGMAEAMPALDTSEDAFDRQIDTNLKGAFFVAKAAARAMLANPPADGGSIIVTASILGLRQAKDLAPYAISKAGVIQMVKSLALEWARYNIRVNAIAPGYFETEINAGFFATEAGLTMLKRVPMRRTGRLEELDGLVLLLASPASSYMTGSILAIDGGHLLSSL